MAKGRVGYGRVWQGRKHIFWPNLLLVILGKIKGQNLERGWVYKPCLEWGRWLNCDWNGVRGSNIVSKHMYIGQDPSLEYSPGCRYGLASGSLKEKHTNFYMHTRFKQTYIQIINIFHYLSFFVCYTGKQWCWQNLCKDFVHTIVFQCGS